MKTINHAVFVGFLSFTSIVLPARATLIQGTDPNFGPNSLTIDTSTQLAWLNLSYTAGLSYDQVLADTQPGGQFSGYSFATKSEVDALFNSAGIPGNGLYPASTVAIQSFVSLLGPSGTINGYPALAGTTQTINVSGEQETPTIYVFSDNGSPEYQVTDSNGDSGDLSTPTIGAWLITPVPEPGTFALGITGLIGLALYRWHRD